MTDLQSNCTTASSGTINTTDKRLTQPDKHCGILYMKVSLGESSTPDNTRIYAIGDVHGHIDLLVKLHQKISDDLDKNPIDQHRIIFLGDYIDRGPDSAGCVEYLIELSAKNEAVICLKGNHEDKLEKFLKDPVAIADSFFTYGGGECAESYGVDMAGYRGDRPETLQKCEELNSNIPAHHIEFYAQLARTVTFGDYMFVHAGVRPGVALDQQSSHDLMWIRSEFIPHQGLYEKVIVHGHTPAFPMEILPNRINVDTQAYDTGVLSCIVLEDKEFRVIDSS